MTFAFLSFLFGCTLTYLITIVSSAIKSSEILENAMLTYALMLMSAYEVSLQQLEQAIVASKMEERQAEGLRRIHENEFESFANKKIKEVVKYIPPAHQNIIKFKNFKQLKVYITLQFRRRHENKSRQEKNQKNKKSR